MPIVKLIELVSRVLPASFFSRVAVLTLWELSKETSNNIDDTAVKVLAEALGIELTGKETKKL